MTDGGDDLEDRLSDAQVQRVLLATHNVKSQKDAFIANGALTRGDNHPDVILRFAAETTPRRATTAEALADHNSSPTINIR